MPFVTVGQENSGNIDLYYEEVNAALLSFLAGGSVTEKAEIVEAG